MGSLSPEGCYGARNADILEEWQADEQPYLDEKLENLRAARRERPRLRIVCKLQENGGELLPLLSQPQLHASALLGFLLSLLPFRRRFGFGRAQYFLGLGNLDVFDVHRL